jgi:hypothetical protein
MAKDDFAEVQRQLETTASELKTATDQSADERSLREMSRLLAVGIPMKVIGGSGLMVISVPGSM